jgi:hypothetical protein
MRSSTTVHVALFHPKIFGLHPLYILPLLKTLLYDGITSHQGQSASGGNDSTMMRHQEQLLYGGVTSHQGQSASGGNDSTMMRHQEQLLYDGVTSC